MTAVIVVLLAGLGSYLFRISMILLAERVTPPETVVRAGGFVAPAAFAALAATGLTAAVHGVGIAHAIPPLAALVVAVVAVRRTGRAYLAVLAGMPTAWLLTAVLAT